MTDTKIIRVTAQCVEYYEHYVRVDANVNEDTVMQFYRDNGANGEFVYDGDPEWTWGDAYEVDIEPDDANDMTDTIKEEDDE